MIRTTTRNIFEPREKSAPDPLPTWNEISVKLAATTEFKYSAQTCRVLGQQAAAKFRDRLRAALKKERIKP